MSRSASLTDRRVMATRRRRLGGWWCGVAMLAISRATAAEPAVDFSREIQPLLAKRCFACHGPDTQEGGLRLDGQAASRAALDSDDRAIVPGDPAASALLARITSDDPELRMPPEGTRLSATQVDALRRWIAEGAEYREHWAFRPVMRPEPPPSAPGTSPIDAFIRDALARKGLPVPAVADRRALLRRATYGVTGLPPTEDAMRDFLADESPDAWERAVDRLLASPHYGEHWARHWLDLVRYADTNSFERDGDKPNAWRYRDYVIRSFNDDKPYDRFVIEQLAGDEAESPADDDLIATGYYRLGVWDDEPADALQARYDWLDDVVSTTGQTFLGLTIGCGRCHDHKIDPITQRDYYALLAFVHNVTPMGGRTMASENIERPLFADAEARRRYEAAVADLAARRRDAQLAVTAIEERFRTSWESETETTVVGGDLDDLEFRFYRDAWRTLPAFDELKPEDTGVVTGNLFDIAVAPSLRPDNFGYVFTGFLKVPAAGDYTFTLDSDDGSRLTIDGREVILYDGIHGEGSPRSATVSLAAGRLPIRLDYFQGIHGKGLSVSWSGPGFASRRLSALPRGKGRGAKETGDLAAALRTDGERLLGVEAMRDYAARKKTLEKLVREEVPVDKALVVTEHGPEAPETFVFFRGNPRADRKPEGRVEPAFPGLFKTAAPTIAPVPESRSSGRRTALARWIASETNPLTARVMANRIWQHHFGRGIVRSASNFGLAGDPPTHPELLDWLASDLVAGGWRLKRLHKAILTSEAYRATSAGVPAALVKDPLNDTFWRFDMRRLAAEELRDSIHVASGEFNPRMFGPGVFPAIPRAVMAGQSVPGKGWGDSPAEEQARRSIYAHLKRSLVTPILADFDVADTDTSCPVRFVTTQPTQALGMMNGEFLQRQAKVFADRVRREVQAGQPAPAADDDTAALVRRAVEIALVRPATDDEVTRGVALVDRLESTDGVGPSRAFELACLMILNLNEFCYLD
jgi:mono/diheme cytochrome c family protein